MIKIKIQNEYNAFKQDQERCEVARELKKKTSDPNKKYFIFTNKRDGCAERLIVKASNAVTCVEAMIKEYLLFDDMVKELLPHYLCEDERETYMSQEDRKNYLDAIKDSFIEDFPSPYDDEWILTIQDFI